MPVRVGDVSTHAIITEFLKLGYVVSIPTSNDCRYDIIVDDGDILHKVQCKTAQVVRGYINFPTSSSNRSKKRDYRDQVDLIAAYCERLNEVYICRPEEVPKTEVRLKLLETDEEQVEGKRYAVNFLFENTVMNAG